MPLLVGGALVGPALTWLGPVWSVTVPVVMLLLAAALAHCLPATGDAPAGPPDQTDLDQADLDRPDSDRPDSHRPDPGHGRSRLPRRVRALVLLSTAYYLAYGPFETAMPGFVRDRLHAEPGAYSLIWALFGLGAVAGVAVAPVLTRRRPGLINALGAAAWGLVMLPIATLTTVPAVAGLFLASGVIWGPYTTVEAGALQQWTPPSRHGFVFGLQRGLLGTAAPVGAAIGAIAVHQAPPHLVLAASAATCMGAGLVALAHPALRKARE
jgi:MFS family permease